MASPDPHQPSVLLEHAAFVRAVARAILWGDDDVEDVVQDTWVTALEHEDARHGALRPWLAGIARRKAFAARRRRIAVRRRERRAARREATPSVSESLVRAETAKRVVEAVLSLPDPYRTALVLRYYEGLPPRAVAKRLDLPVETVRTHVKRGLARLRRHLREEGRARHEDWRATLLPLIPTSAARAASWASTTAALGVSIMSKTTWIVTGALVAAVLLALWVAPRAGEPEDGAQARQASRTLPEDASPTAILGGHPQDAGRTQSQTAGARGTCTLRGAVLREMAPVPDFGLLATAHDGFDEEGALLHRAEIRTDGHGHFAWTLPRHPRPMFVVVRAADPQRDDRSASARVLPDVDPPCGLLLFLWSHPRIVGQVTDETGAPVAGAYIFTVAGTAPVACDAQGRYEVRAAAGRGNVHLTAGAPGYALTRASTVLPAGEAEARLDFRLKPEFAVFGAVTDPEGRPLEGAVVKTLRTSFYNRAVTDCEGHYRLGHLDPAQPRHSVYARHPSFTEVRVETMTASSPVRVDLRLGRGTRVAGEVVDEEGRPLPGTDLYIGFSRSAYDRLDAIAADGGKFVFEAVGPGPQTLVAERAGYAPRMLAVEVPESTDAMDDLRVEMYRGRTLAGRVTDHAGEPVEHAYCSVRYRQSYIGSRALTDAEGRFSIPDLPPDAIQLEVYRLGYVRLSTQVPCSSNTELALVLERAAGLAGRVVDDRTDEPVTSFIVRLVQPQLESGEQWGSGYGARWAEGQRFSNPAGLWDTKTERLRAGDVFGVEISAEGYATVRNPHVVACADPDPEALVIRLERGTTLMGVVLAPGPETPVAGARVLLYDDAHPLNFQYPEGDIGRSMAKTDAAGVFRISNATSGPVHVALLHDDHPPTFLGPFALAGGVVDLGALHMEPAARIEGFVGDEEGGPLPNAVIRARAVAEGLSPGDPAYKRATCFNRVWQTSADGDGRFVLAALPAGRFSVAHVTPGGLYGRWEERYVVHVRLERGGRESVRLAPDGTATLRCRVTAARGLPAGITATIRAAREPDGVRPDVPSRSVDVVAGTFAFLRLVPGDYTLTLEWTELPPGGGGLPQPNDMRQEVTVGDGESRFLDVDLDAR